MPMYIRLVQLLCICLFLGSALAVDAQSVRYDSSAHSAKPTQLVTTLPTSDSAAERILVTYDALVSEVDFSGNLICELASPRWPRRIIVRDKKGGAYINGVKNKDLPKITISEHVQVTGVFEGFDGTDGVILNAVKVEKLGNIWKLD